MGLCDTMMQDHTTGKSEAEQQLENICIALYGIKYSTHTVLEQAMYSIGTA